MWKLSSKAASDELCVVAVSSQYLKGSMPQACVQDSFRRQSDHRPAAKLYGAQRAVLPKSGQADRAKVLGLPVHESVLEFLQGSAKSNLGC